MKKLAVVALIFVFTLTACSPNLLAPAANSAAPTANVAATVNAMVQTANAQTLVAQPSPTATTPPTETSTVTPVVDVPTIAVNTDTAIPNLTTTPATATSGPAGLLPTTAASATPTLVPGQVTASPTNGIMTYGTLPPANRPFVGAELINKSQREAYISLQVVTDQGYTIIEYPVKTVVKVKIPTGDYTYVAWVGGRQMVGYFKVSKGSDITITIYKDKVVISQGSSYP